MLKKFLFTIILCSSSLSFSFAKYGVWGLNNINIISREEWGADESCRMSDNPAYDGFKKAQQKAAEDEYMSEIEDSYKSSTTSSSTPKKSVYDIRNEYLQRNFLKDIQIDNVIKTENGKELWWGKSYHYNKTKLVIHHTTNSNSGLENKQDVMNLLQAVYKDHALNNGWGDIGYNFVIDKFGNIYEGRSGGAGVVGAHASRNNTDSIGIALIGNFNDEKPTDSAMNSLVILLTELSRKYNINPYDKKVFHKETSISPYLKDVTEDSIVGHKDTKATACPGINLYSRMSEIKNRVSRALQKGYDLTSATSSSYLVGSNTENTGTQNIVASNFSTPSKMDEISIPENEETTANYSDLDSMKSVYIKKTGFKIATTSMKKISYKISLTEAQKLMKQNVKVMLYEASTSLTGWNIACQSGCTVYLDGTKFSNIKSINISQANGKLSTTIKNKKYTPKEINIYGGSGLVSIANYNRKSYAGVPRNLFRGNIHIKKDNINIIGSGVKNQYVVINEVGFDDYMRGIGEISEKQSIEKIKAMSLIIKDYVLFYINKKNTHPSIPANVSYNAVDDARIFQKYVGYGYEGVSKKWFDALAVTKNQIILYNNYIPILPYYNCSAGFSWSAQEKYGWTDTPYLVSQLDFAKCDNFNGHGVGLSGEGAQKMAESGKNYKDIINYYYKGMTIKDLK